MRPNGAERVKNAMGVVLLLGAERHKALECREGGGDEGGVEGAQDERVLTELGLGKCVEGLECEECVDSGNTACGTTLYVSSKFTE